MLVIHSTYVRELSRVEPHRQAHGEWVSKYIHQGIFLFAGPKKDKRGGIILAKSIEEETLAKILSEDSYLQAGLVENQIIEFVSAFAQPELINVDRY